MHNLIFLVNLGILVSGESDDFDKAGDFIESGCSVGPFDSVDLFDSGEYFDSGDHGSCSVFGESYHS